MVILLIGVEFFTMFIMLDLLLLVLCLLNGSLLLLSFLVIEFGVIVYLMYS